MFRVVLGKLAAAAAVIVMISGFVTSGPARGEITVVPRLPFVDMWPPVVPAGVMLPGRVGLDLEPEIHCLTQNVYFEARSEPTIGQVAVAMVTLNRVLSDRFPDTICGVVRQGGNSRNRCQFSWYCDGKTDIPGNAEAWQRAREVAYSALFQRVTDPTRGALWYHADYVKPRWARQLRRTQRIGRHVYYGES